MQGNDILIGRFKRVYLKLTLKVVFLFQFSIYKFQLHIIKPIDLNYVHNFDNNLTYSPAPSLLVAKN